MCECVLYSVRNAMTIYKPPRSQMLLIRFCYHCGLNTKQHSAKSAMAKAISGHGAPKSGMATAITAIPVAPPMYTWTETLRATDDGHVIGVSST